MLPLTPIIEAAAKGYAFDPLKACTVLAEHIELEKSFIDSPIISISEGERYERRLKLYHLQILHQALVNACQPQPVS